MINENILINDLLANVHKEHFKDYQTGAKGTYYSQKDVFDCINSQPKIGGWIPCSERLPECEWGAETEALLYQHKGTGSIEVGYYGRGGKFRDSYFRHYRNGTDGVDSKDVIAWQPLPEAYHGQMD